MAGHLLLEHIDEGSLADAGFSGYEDHLSPAAQCRLPTAIQVGQACLPPYYIPGR
jgi:hypothetical protein